MTDRPKLPLKAIGFKKALDLLRLPGRRLVFMHTPSSPNGRAYYVVPGGYVEPETAQKIIAQADVICGKDGLFPGHAQTWRISS